MVRNEFGAYGIDDKRKAAEAFFEGPYDRVYYAYQAKEAPIEANFIIALFPNNNGEHEVYSTSEDVPINFLLIGRDLRRILKIGLSSTEPVLTEEKRKLQEQAERTMHRAGLPSIVAFLNHPKAVGGIALICAKGIGEEYALDSLKSAIKDLLIPQLGL